MLNQERYKTPKERAEAFSEFCISRKCDDCMCAEQGKKGRLSLCEFKWLALEAEEEKPLPCPFCGEEAKVFTKMDGNVLCGYEVHCKGCWSSAFTCNSKAEAIAAWNRRTK